MLPHIAAVGRRSELRLQLPEGRLELGHAARRDQRLLRQQHRSQLLAVRATQTNELPRVVVRWLSHAPLIREARVRFSSEVGHPRKVCSGFHTPSR